MKRILKELYGSGILFFYFFKWPFFIVFPYLYNNGLNNNYILNILWFFMAGLILKDFYMLFKDRGS
ncbi:hypothetical protein [Sulfurimonas denitrificans]|uniref:hypothetical protein n=1 Tax=Sulfurimonas denitrificans TaxID=39766 RepID=UPI0002FB9134|nr:hypothetical protein [Sulfurimonas denitrificans]MDD3443755.1 hypothetical protein [Sulfurimonas denitrificans]